MSQTIFDRHPFYHDFLFFSIYFNDLPSSFPADAHKRETARGMKQSSPDDLHQQRVIIINDNSDIMILLFSIWSVCGCSIPLVGLQFAGGNN